MEEQITLTPTGPEVMESQELLAKYLSVRERTSHLCRPLQPEDHLPQPFVHASPPKWHLAHTTWFFEEFILKTHMPGYRTFNEDFNFLFNSYYNNAGERIPRDQRGTITRPELDKVRDYRQYVDEHIAVLIDSENFNKKISELLILGMNHEQQHQELLITDLKLTFYQNPLFPVYRDDFILVGDHNEHTGITKCESGIYPIGNEGKGFCYDNETARHKVYLHEFQIENQLVTNREFIEFINDGGYTNFNLWHDEGWQWVNNHEINAPLYWVAEDGQWHHYTLAGLKPVDPDAMVCHVSFYEAYAFAEWAGKRLPTEFEWEAASGSLPWGKRWEWTGSAHLPYPGFNKARGAIGEYNGKFMINQMVLRGASRATAPGHSRSTYRNFFHPHYRWQLTGIRLATHTSNDF